MSFIVSDVVGDDPAFASGPRFPGGPAPQRRWRPSSNTASNCPPPCAPIEPTPPRPARQRSCLARNGPRHARRVSLDAGAAGRSWRDCGHSIRNIEGEARDIGRMHAALARDCSASPLPLPLFLSGGETTVTLGNDSPGRGGRNGEFCSLCLYCWHGRHPCACRRYGWHRRVGR